MKTHQENQSNICIFCLNKTKRMHKIQTTEKIIIFLSFFDPKSQLFPTHVCATCSVLYKNFVNNQNTSSHTKLAARIPVDRYQQGIELGNYNVEGTKCACFFCKAVRDRLKSSGKLNTRSPNASHVEENESIQHRYNHIDNRKRICLFCLQRTQRMYLLKEYERITSFIPCYNPKSAFFPLTACATCIKKYGSYLNVQSDENLQNLRAQVAKQEYFYLNEDDTIHDLIENCSCFFCIKTLQIDEASERSITTRSSTSSSSNVENIQSVIPKEDSKISKKSVKKTMNVCGNCYNLLILNTYAIGELLLETLSNKH